MKAPVLFSLLLVMRFAASAHAFTAKDILTGKETEFPMAGKKATVVVFLSAKCPCSNSHEASLKKLSEKYSSKGFQFVGVHSNQDENDVMTKSHFKGSALPFSVVADPGAKVADELKALKTPHVFVYKNNEIVFQGGVDDSADAGSAKQKFLESALNEIDQGKPVTVSKVRTLGCAIKR